MIEKITPDHILGLDGLPTTIMPDSAKLMKKINELVDAVNELQKDYDNVCVWVGEQKLKIPAENVQDKFAEQRKWIGKLCWFWNNDNEPDTCFGVLTGLFDEADRPFERSIGQQLYRYCRPVKPDDDIIYKGE